MKDSARCSTVPDPLVESGTLFLAPPRSHTLNGIKALMGSMAVAYEEPGAGLLAIPIAKGLLDRLSEQLPAALGPAELQDTRSLMIGPGATIGLSDLAAMQPLATLVARIRGRWLAEMIRDGRLTSYFQPIVPTRATTDVFAYECLLRGVDLDGMLIAPDRMYQAAREADLLFPLDRSARLTAIREAAEFGLDEAGVLVFVNFNPDSIYDPVHCLRSTIAAISRTVFDPGRIVFEIVECDRGEDIRHLCRIVGYYREAGFRVALGNFQADHASLRVLAELRPDFVKIDMRLVRGVDHDPHQAEIVRSLIGLARELAIETVAEGVETEEESDWLRTHGVDYVQGYYVARPDRWPPQPRDFANRRARHASPAKPDRHCDRIPSPTIAPEFAPASADDA